MTWIKRRKGWRLSCDVGEVTEWLENELCYDYNYELRSFSNLFRHFTYVTTHSPTLPSLYLRHSSFSNPSVASPTSQLILQPFPRFTYVTTHSPTLLSLLLPRRFFTYVTWRAAHGSCELFPTHSLHFSISIVVSYLASPGLILSRVSFLVEVFRGFPSTVTNLRKFGTNLFPGIIWPS